MRESEHFTPETLEETAALLSAADAPLPPRVNGTRLIVEVPDGSRPCTLILDMTRVPELNRLDYDERSGLRIGAAVPYPSILEFPPVHRLYPILVDAGSPHGRGEAGEHPTLGAILGNISASTDIAPSLVCLRASAILFGLHGWSELGVEAFFTGYERASIQPGEFVVDVRLPAPPPRSGGAYLSLDWARDKRLDSAGQRSFDRAQDRLSGAHEASRQSAAGIGAFLVMEKDLVTCCGGRLAFSTAPRTARRALDAERFLAGKYLDAEAVQKAADLVLQDARREGMDGAMMKDRLEGVRALARRAVLEALARAQGVAAS